MREISRLTRSPSSGPSTYSGIALSHTSLPSETASAPAQKYSRQSSKSRIPPLAMIGSRIPASRSSATTRSPIGLIARPLTAPKRFFSHGSPVRGSRRSPLTVLIAVIPAHPDSSARRACQQVVLVGRDLEDHGVPALRYGASQALLEDLAEREVDVVARGVELDGGDLTRLDPLVHDLDQLLDLVRAEATDRDDPVELRGTRKVFVEVALDPDVRPAERVEPAGIDLAQRAPVQARASRGAR